MRREGEKRLSSLRDFRKNIKDSSHTCLFMIGLKFLLFKI